MADEHVAQSSTTDELAETCVRFVQQALGLPLDYTPDTLPLLDHYVRTRAAEASGAVASLLVPALGAYFGEVVRRSLPGARFHAPEEHYDAYRVELDACFLCFNPLGVAAEVLRQDDAPGMNAHFQLLGETQDAVASALEHSESVSSEDYYSFTTRYEALELVVAALLRFEAQTQPQPRRFGPEVYRAAVGESSAGKGEA